MMTLSRQARHSTVAWPATLVAAAVAVFGPLGQSAPAAVLSLPLVAAPASVAALEPGPARTLLSAAVRVGEPVAPVGGARAAMDGWQAPLAFEPADATAPADADFTARGPGYTVFVGAGGALLALQQAEARDDGSSTQRGPGSRHRASADRVAPAPSRLVRLRWEGADPAAQAVAEAPLPGRVHRLRGADPRRWETDLQPHGRVRYHGLYPGIDLAFYGNGRELEYDLLVAPGASVDAARFRFDGVRSVRLDAQGQLLLATGNGDLVQRRPVAYQDGPGGRRGVPASYRLEPDGSVGLSVGEYDRSRTLVIDPVLSYATFLGGTGFDQSWDLAVDADGAAYVVGETESTSFAALRIVSTNAFITNYQGGQPGIAGDAFVAKVAPDGTAVEWFTYLGGKDLDVALTVSLGAGNEPVVGGFTTSTNFPVSAGAFQGRVLGETNRYTGRAPLMAFVSRLKSDGSGLVASTLLGGAGEDQVLDLGLLGDGSVVAVGSTTSSNLPVTAGAAQSTYGGGTDGFLGVLAADFSTLRSLTYIGGSGRDSAEGVVVDAAAGRAYALGITASTNFPVRGPIQAALAGPSDAWVAGGVVGSGAWDYATYLGGNADDYAYRGALAPGGAVWVAGETGSTNFPVVAAFQGTNAGAADGFITRLSGDGQVLEFSSYLGGGFDDSIWDVSVDGAGALHMTGEVNSTAIPGLSTNTSVQATNAGLADILVAWLAADGTLSSTFYGSVGDERGYAVATDAAGGTYVSGRVRSVVFPVSSTNVAQPSFGGDVADGFVLKLARPPALLAALTTAGVEVSWPAPNPGFVLESAPVGATQAAWSREGTAILATGGRHVVRLPQSATNCQFRLRWAP